MLRRAVSDPTGFVETLPRPAAIDEFQRAGSGLLQAGWSEHAADLHHFRDRYGAEIDLIVSDRRSGRFAGIEIKLTSTPLERHARTLASFRDTHGSRFTVGLVIHAGPHILPLGDRLCAVPVSTLWRTDPAAA